MHILNSIDVSFLKLHTILLKDDWIFAVPDRVLLGIGLELESFGGIPHAQLGTVACDWNRFPVVGAGDCWEVNSDKIFLKAHLIR